MAVAVALRLALGLPVALRLGDEVPVTLPVPVAIGLQLPVAGEEDVLEADLEGVPVELRDAVELELGVEGAVGDDDPVRDGEDVPLAAGQPLPLGAVQHDDDARELYIHRKDAAAVCIAPATPPEQV